MKEWSNLRFHAHTETQRPAAARPGEGGLVFIIKESLESLNVENRYPTHQIYQALASLSHRYIENGLWKPMASIPEKVHQQYLKLLK